MVVVDTFLHYAHLITIGILLFVTECDTNFLAKFYIPYICNCSFDIINAQL